MSRVVVIAATALAVLAVILLIVMAISELNPDTASMFGMYPL